jgi:diadenosine tetraphosphate (Ap4A) HIT family hydrolase
MSQIYSCEMCDDFGAPGRRLQPGWIADLDVSTAVVARNQAFRGYTILVYNRGHATELYELSKEERSAFMEDLARIARAIHDAYHPIKINYELLGNLEPHLHWHVIPRRREDPIDPRYPVWGQTYEDVMPTDQDYRKIALEIREHIT